MCRSECSFDSNGIAIGAATLVGVCLSVLACLYLGPNIREDAYITLRYAQHIAAGQGFVFNSGERVLGTTTPLYALLIAVLARFGFDIAAIAFAIGILANATSVVVLSYLTARYLKPAALTFALILFALSSPVVSYAVSGMETSLYILLILLTVAAHLKGRSLLAGGICGLVVWTRPDGLILFAVLFAHAVITKRQGLLRELAGFVGLLLPWAIFATIYFGSPIPQSLIAKAYTDFTPDRLASLRNFIWYFSDMHGRWLLPLSLAFVVGLIGSKRNPALLILISWAIVYSAAFIVANKFLFPEDPFEWYFVPLLAPFTMGAGIGLEKSISLVSRLAGKRSALPYAGLSLMMACALATGYWAVLQFQHSELERIIGGRESVYREMAGQMAQVGVNDELVAAFEIGAFSYFYPGPVLDLHGLVSPQSVGVDPYETLSNTRPSWIMTYQDMLPDNVAQSDWFQQEYKPVYAVGTWEGRRVMLYRRYAPNERAVWREALGILGENMQLQDVSLKRTTIDSQKAALHVTLTWRALGQIDDRYTVFTHLVNGANQQIGQNDGEPEGNEAPTNAWHDGQTVVDVHDILVDSHSIDDEAVLVIGAYKTGDASDLLHWAQPTVPAWPHELRIPLSSLTN